MSCTLSRGKAVVDKKSNKTTAKFRQRPDQAASDLFSCNKFHATDLVAEIDFYKIDARSADGSFINQIAEQELITSFWPVTGFINTVLSAHYIQYADLKFSIYRQINFNLSVLMHRVWQNIYL